MAYFLENGTIDLSEWECFGGGATSDSYFCKNDDSVMLKLYKAMADEDTLIREKKMTDAIIRLGLPVPAFLEIVHFEGRPGAIFQRVKNKKSFAALMKENPEHFEDYMKEFSFLCKNLHQTRVDVNEFPSRKKHFIDVIEGASFIPSDEKKAILDFTKALPDSETALHGDLQITNFIKANSKNYIIDVADFGYGYPLIDLGIMYFMCEVSGPRGGTAVSVFHMSSEQLHKCWTLFAKYYANVNTEEELKNFNEEVKPFSIYFILEVASRSKLAGSLLVGYQEALKVIYSK